VRCSCCCSPLGLQNSTTLLVGGDGRLLWIESCKDAGNIGYICFGPVM
jgi:hypothetical protein